VGRLIQLPLSEKEGVCGDTISLSWAVSPNIYCDVISYDMTIIGSDGYLYSDTSGTDPAPPIPYILFINNQHDIIPSQIPCTQGCEGDVTKWETERIYQINNQWGTAYNNSTWVTEDVGVDQVSGACASQDVRTHTGGDWSSPDGKINDQFAICNEVCCISTSNVCEIDVTQVIGLNGTVANINGIVLTCSEVSFF
jgi:hypothetical protein